MGEQEQRKVFVQNLKHYISVQEKNQREIADAIGVSPQTFNTWCQGIALPRMGKVELLADYFGIRKSDLLEEHTLDRFSAESAQMLVQIKNNPALMQLCKEFLQLDSSEQQSVVNIVHSMIK